jgi:hypothetical protein
MAEQLLVELKLSLIQQGSNIWLGVVMAAEQQWYMLDSTLVGNGEPSNQAPYAHW